MKQRLWHFKSRYYQFARDLLFLKWILDAERRNLIKLISRIQVLPDRILDVGSGTGSTLDLLPETEALIVTDSSAAMLQKLTLNIQNTIPVCADGLHLPFDNQTFDLVSCIGVSEYFMDTSCLLHEISRVLKSNGHLLITAAPFNIFNFLRRFLGHPLHLIHQKEWDMQITGHSFQMIECRNSLMQVQYLCVKQ